MGDARLEIYPQMIDYDRMPAGQIVPYAMLSGPMSFTSTRINTDRHGFRCTIANDRKYRVEDLVSLENVSFIVGGSTVFGVGAGSDETTIASILAKKTGEPWLNLGVRGAVSLQEYIHLIRFLSLGRIKRIIFFSGINDLYINLVHTFKADFDRRFEESSGQFSFYSWQRQAAAALFSKLYRTEPAALIALPISEMCRYPFLKKQKAPPMSIRMLSFQDRLDQFYEIFSRNFMLYRGLQHATGAQLLYVLQPFALWPARSPSSNEMRVFDELNEKQKGTVWARLRSELASRELYQSLKEKLSATATLNSIQFVDSNQAIRNPDEDYFVDSVHLSDVGNDLMSDLILRSLPS